jgi:DNA-directed RNA polymerase specialized sigma54-like protein
VRTYTATVTREGKWWMISVREIDGLTQARRLSEVEEMARELVAVSTGSKLSDVAVEIKYADIDDLHLNESLTTIHREKAEAAALEAEAIKKTKTLVRSLVDRAVPLRDIGAMLGLSFQRVHQLAKG